MSNRIEYRYETVESPWNEEIYESVLQRLPVDASDLTVLDAGCGNGALCHKMAAAGYNVVGVDSSASGIELARRTSGGVRFVRASLYDDLSAVLQERFRAVTAIEVIEHLYDPRSFLKQVASVLEEQGQLVISTPYHGYLKNLALALSARMDDHFTALWDGGHIKFWSRKTLTALLEEEGFEVVHFEGVGRIPYLWKSMLVVAKLRK